MFIHHATIKPEGKVRVNFLLPGNTIVDANGVWLTFTQNEVYPVTHARIAALTSAAPGSVTVSYTNVQYGTNYVLSYSTTN